MTRPVAAGRVVANFTFEEQKTNPGDIPQNWYRGQDDPQGIRRDRFPYWNGAKLSYVSEGGEAFNSDGSVELPSRGGNTSLILEAGVIPVFADADYVVNVRVMTRHISSARAFIIARLLDARGKPLPIAEFRSDAIISEGTWKPITVGVPGGVAGSTFLQLELQVLQAKEFAENPMGNLQIWKEDLGGSAFFDDITVMQPPRVEIHTESPTNILKGDKPASLFVNVRDLTGEALNAHVELIDHTGKLLDSTNFRVDSGLINNEWKPKLAGFGWYRAKLDVLAGNRRVGGSYTDFVYIEPRTDLGDESSGALSQDSASSVAAIKEDRTAFGIVTGEVDTESLALLPEAASRLDARHFALPVLYPDLTPLTQPRHTAALIDALSLLLAEGHILQLCVGPVPTQLAPALHLSARDGWALGQANPAAWTPLIAPIMDRFGQRIDTWQFGRYFDTFGVDASPALVTEALKARKQLASLVSGARVIIPLDMSAHLLTGPLPANVATMALADPHLTRDQLGSFMRAATDAHDTIAPPDALVISRLPEEGFSRADAAAECAKRMVEYWRLSHSSDMSAIRDVRLDLEQPWHLEHFREPRLSPTVEVAAWTSTIERLAGRRITGTFPAAKGVVCMVLSPATDTAADRGGALVLWNESCLPALAVLQAPLGGSGIRVVDVFGNATPATFVRNELGEEEVRVTATSSPVFIEGIDINLARFIAGIKISPTLLECNNSRHELELTIENPWRTGITGTLTLLRPGGGDISSREKGWRVAPRSFNLSAAAGETLRIPFAVSFSPAEEMGPRDFVFTAKLAAEKAYKPVLITRQLEIGLSDLALELTSSVVGAKNNDLIIEATIANRGKLKRTLAITTYAPDMPRSKATISELAPGTQTQRRFSFAQSYELIRGKRVVVTVGDAGSEAQLTRSILIP